MITVKAQWPKFFEYVGMCDAGVTQAAVCHELLSCEHCEDKDG